MKEDRIIAGTKKPLGSVEQARVMFAPFHAFTGPEILQRTFAHMEKILHQQAGARQIDRSVGIRQTKFLLFAERVFASRLVIKDIAASSLTVQPLANVTFVGVGVIRELGR